MVNGISLNANNFNYSGIVSNGGHGKLYVPVAQSNLIYAHFDHVTGVAAKPNQKGVSISKIQILNSLLNQLISMKNQPKPNIAPENMDDSQLDALIQSTQSKIQTNIQVAQATGYGLAGAAPEAGAVFSLDV
ncbi:MULTISPECIES: hypothetical protein [unclassified Treponema]|uniref:hypothetical protein n=1 Tax=unclassified Treponema TaxID=2638727 RepID=UPI001B119BB3|nr:MULTISPECIES: hypothetical protein [unclassified Treponema]MBO6219629.1 hypothetical protein [Treponema sp.]MBQ8678697.1 hypothetical protein [Treponema sp.]